MALNVIAVDVGTTSVRLAIVSFQDETRNQVKVLASHEKDIGYQQDGLKFEQSSAEIWQAICDCNKICLRKSNIAPNSIQSIAFSATCSLVIGEPNSRDPSANNGHNRDIIMWMDHRAIEEARQVTESKAPVLEQFGGVCSPEFSLAKLLWLKSNQPERLAAAQCLLELPDWLVYRCIGGEPSEFRPSLCCVVCKWGYNAEKQCHCDTLSSLDASIWTKVNPRASPPGSIAGYLCEQAAMELGLKSSSMLRGTDQQNGHEPTSRRVKVATSLIDAHSGMLGMLSVSLETHGINLEIDKTLCSLAGTSSCHMLLSRSRNFTHGIWGPYKDVVLEGYHLLEAGQSLTGKLIEICIGSHEEGKELLLAGKSMKDIVAILNDQISSRRGRCSNHETPLHVLPTYHGNRSPLANPRLKGGIYGLSSEGPQTLAQHYLATVESIVYETRLIVETLGLKLDTILVSGGLTKNAVFMQTLADVLSCQSVKMSVQNVDFMVLGSSLVARQAAFNAFDGVRDVAQAAPHGGPLAESSVQNIVYHELGVEIFRPNKDRAPYHEKKYLCYKEFVELSKRIDKILHLQ